MQYVPRRRSASLSDDGTQAEVLAAGALIWRLYQGQLQVLLIHRPRYDDWSFPKGKLDEGETLPECAVRECAEEASVKIRLGVPLPVTRYEIQGQSGPRTKEVWYWAAQIIDGRPKPDGQEADEIRWVTPEQARGMLSQPGDLEPLDELQHLCDETRLHTVPFVVLRHAKAKPRSSWSKPESERPLAATGKRQAKTVEQLLSAWRPRTLHCSPWKRCAETVAPYVKKHRHRIKYRKSLTEKRAAQDPAKTARRVRRSLELVVPSLVCTHRPVLPLVLNALESWLDSPSLAEAIPQADPYLQPGAVLIAQQAVDRGGRIVSLEIYEPYED
nr:NUDIX hydrolase [Nesterenkonia sp. NBAIMH1]